MYDEYSNDVLDLPEGSCFPRVQYRKKTAVRSGSLSRRSSFAKEKQDAKSTPSRSVSLKNSILDLNPVKLVEHLFMECERSGVDLVARGVITSKDVDESRAGKVGKSVVGIGLPAYCILKALLRSVEADSDGILLSNGTLITSTNRPKDMFFDWFFDPLLIMKEQISRENLSKDDEDYLCKLVLLGGNPTRIKDLNVASPPLHCERRRAELDAIARRLQGITNSVSRYPTYKRRFNALVKTLSENLEDKLKGMKSSDGSRSRSGLAQVFTRKSFTSRDSDRDEALKNSCLGASPQQQQSV